MSLDTGIDPLDFYSFPRTRGDEPLMGVYDVEDRGFSPHTRG